MSPTEKTRIKRILPIFRKALLQFINSPTSRDLDCHQNSDLEAACAISSHTLGTLLNIRGIKCCKLALGIYLHKKIDLKRLSPENINHVWVTIGDYILDVTASQFGDKEIIFRKKRKKNEPFLELISISVDEMEDEKKNWPRTQSPSKTTLSSILKYYSNLSGESCSI